ncbi:MAG: pseudouridine synthase [Pseudomonadales bacterium]
MTTNADSGGEKLQKVLADLGLGSRREMERWIEAGRVVVAGEPAHIGQRVGPDDLILVDGNPVRRRQTGETPVRVLLYNKLVGQVCTRSDPEGRPTIFDQLPRAGGGRWISIGRLDIATSGLLLLTNDGSLANRMMHPSTGLDREYAVRVNGVLTTEQRQRLIDGIVDEGERLAFSDIQYYNGRGTNHWYHVVLMEGKNREIRRLFESCHLMVSRLKRVRFGPVVLPSKVTRGHWIELSEDDIRTLYRVLKLPAPTLPTTGGRQREERRGKGKKEASALIPYPEIAAP